MKDGGPAFPVDVLTGGAGKAGPVYKTIQGMSLRDYFAAAALQGVFACPSPDMSVRVEDKELVVAHCYLYADAMLAEREKGEK